MTLALSCLLISNCSSSRFFWNCLVRSRFERKSSRDEVDSVFRDVHDAKSAGPDVVVFPRHFGDFRVLFFANTKFNIFGIDGLISLFYCSF